jgi:hypothetical protein
VIAGKLKTDYEKAHTLPLLHGPVRDAIAAFRDRPQ